MNSDLSKVKVGDWIWTIQDGWIKIIAVTDGGDFPILTDFSHYSLDGKHSIDDKHPSAFVEPPECFNPGPKPCEFVKGQRVLVRNGKELYRRYFSHMGRQTGFYCCFIGGRDEWSSHGVTESWKECIAREEDDENNSYK